MLNLRNTFTELNSRREQALIAFVMAGIPDLNTSLDYIKAVEQGGCDILELGVPFSDPVADGEVIERFHHRGVAQGLNLERVLDFAGQVRKSVHMPIILFCYYNPIYQRGIPRLMSELEQLDISAVIVPDLPLDEMGAMSGYPVEVIPMAAPSTLDDRLALCRAMNPSFIYCVSVKGVTGVRDLPEAEIKKYLERVKAATACRLALGFGISGPEHVARFRSHVDALVVGSFLAGIMEEPASADAVRRKLEAETARLKAATRMPKEGG